MEFQTRFSAGSADKGVDYKDSPSLTQQHFKNECDINKIIERAEKTGVLGDPNGVPNVRPMFGDFSTSLDFLQMEKKIADVKSIFQHLPAKVREKFGNDAGKLIDFVADNNNLKEAVELGLLPKSLLPADGVNDAGGVAPAQEAVKAG